MGESLRRSTVRAGISSWLAALPTAHAGRRFVRRLDEGAHVAAQPTIGAGSNAAYHLAASRMKGAAAAIVEIDDAHAAAPRSARGATGFHGCGPSGRTPRAIACSRSSVCGTQDVQVYGSTQPGECSGCGPWLVNVGTRSRTSSAVPVLMCRTSPRTRGGLRRSATDAPVSVASGPRAMDRRRRSGR